MGLLVKGTWHDQWYDTDGNGGKFIREDAQFREQISVQGPFKAEAGRYHLFVSLACPWAHRTLIMRAFKGLQDSISVSVVHPDMLTQGWAFSGPALASEAPVGDPLLNLQHLHQLYTRVKPDYTGRVTVPVLYDRHLDRIVSNESSDILRVFNESFNELTGNERDYYPSALRPDIDSVNELVYHQVNNGVYKAGFATSQTVYEQEVQQLFVALAQLDERLQAQPWLVGDQLTEADIRLFTTLVRFDAVYHGHFKCNLRPISSLVGLQSFVERFYELPGVAATTDMVHIKRHYYFSHQQINGSQVVPHGPELPWYQQQRVAIR